MMIKKNILLFKLGERSQSVCSAVQSQIIYHSKCESWNIRLLICLLSVTVVLIKWNSQITACSYWTCTLMWNSFYENSFIPQGFCQVKAETFILLLVVDVGRYSIDYCFQNVCKFSEFWGNYRNIVLMSSSTVFIKKESKKVIDF